MIAGSRAAAIPICALFGAAAIVATGNLARAEDDADRDGDGVPDNVDVCPDTAGPKEWRGCPPPPDRDGDHVADRDDLCPDQAGAAGGGCPQYRYARVTRERIEIAPVLFDERRARFLPRSWPLLDDVALALRDNRGFRIVIVGHDKEPRIARKLAAAVRAYLMKRHVSGARLRVEGQGPAGQYSSNVDFVITRRR